MRMNARLNVIVLGLLVMGHTDALPAGASGKTGPYEHEMHPIGASGGCKDPAGSNCRLRALAIRESLPLGYLVRSVRATDDCYPLAIPPTTALGLALRTALEEEELSRLKRASAQGAQSDVDEYVPKEAGQQSEQPHVVCANPDRRVTSVLVHAEGAQVIAAIKSVVDEWFSENEVRQDGVPAEEQ